MNLKKIKIGGLYDGNILEFLKKYSEDLLGGLLADYIRGFLGGTLKDDYKHRYWKNVLEVPKSTINLYFKTIFGDTKDYLKGGFFKSFLVDLKVY